MAAMVVTRKPRIFFFFLHELIPNDILPYPSNAFVIVIIKIFPKLWQPKHNKNFRSYELSLFNFCHGTRKSSNSEFFLIMRQSTSKLSPFHKFWTYISQTYPKFEKKDFERNSEFWPGVRIVFCPIRPLKE